MSDVHVRAPWITNSDSSFELWSFQKGDVVEVSYNDQYGMYMIRATEETLYFVHPDSLVNLDIPPGKVNMNEFVLIIYVDMIYLYLFKSPILKSYPISNDISFFGCLNFSVSVRKFFSKT